MIRKPALVSAVTIMVGVGLLIHAGMRRRKKPIPAPIAEASWLGIEVVPDRRAPVAVLPALAVLYGVGLMFYVKQNEPGRLGGPITVENALWLTYALGAWYVLPGVFARSNRVPPVIRRICAWYLASFVARGAIEMYLMHGPKAWIPPYGIAHDGAMIAAVAGMKALWRDDLDRLEIGAYSSFPDALMAGLAAEMLFAWRFYEAVDRRTDFLWFADYSPRFAALNPIMWGTVILAHADLGLRLAELYSKVNTRRE